MTVPVVDEVPEELLPQDVQGCVFDCDGTLIDSMADHYEAWKHACAQFGMDLKPKVLVDLAGKPPSELFDIVMAMFDKTGQVDREEFFRIKTAHFETCHRTPVLIEPVMKIVRAAQARGLPMAVASGGTKRNVERSLKEAGIFNLFQAVVCAEDVERGKPAPDGFLLAAQRIGVDSAHCVGYEDAKLGMEAIRAAKFKVAVDVTVLEGYPHLI